MAFYLLNVFLLVVTVLLPVLISRVMPRQIVIAVGCAGLVVECLALRHGEKFAYMPHQNWWSWFALVSFVVGPGAAAMLAGIRASVNTGFRVAVSTLGGAGIVIALARWPLP